MLGNLSIKAKLVSLVSIFIVIFISINIYINLNLNSQEVQFKKMQNLAKMKGFVSGTLTGGLQITSAIRGMLINPNDTKTLANLEKGVVTFEKNIQNLKKPQFLKLSQGFKKFNIEPLSQKYISDVRKVITKIKEKRLTKDDISTYVVKSWRPIKKKLKSWNKASDKKDNLFETTYVDGNSTILTTILLLSIISFILIAIYSYVVINSIGESLKKVQSGIGSFFDFLNKKNTHAQLINLNTNDEFGKMALEINQNIQNIEKSIKDDELFIKDTERVMENLSKGSFSQHVKANTSSPTLEELKNTINNTLDNLKNKFGTINILLEEYANLNYTNKLQLNGIEKDGVFELLQSDITKLRDSITVTLI